MPKTSKVKMPGSKPGNARPVPEDRGEFYCSRCTRHFKKQKTNFPASQSSLYKGNNGYLTVCNHCMDELLDHYKIALGSEPEAIRRICLKFDIYWNPEIYQMLNKTHTSSSRIRAYISKTNLYKYVGKTYDDTMDEERDQSISEVRDVINLTAEDDYETEKLIVDKSIIRYWGTGFTPEMYIELEERRNYWLSTYPDDVILSPGEDALLRQICNLEISINHDRAEGKPIDKSVNTLNSLLGSMNIKPSQKRENDENYIPFGVSLMQFEDGYPIPDPDPDFEDVDGLRKNVIAWFLGALCKTSGIDNIYSREYEEELAKYTVERPEYNDDEDMI